MWQLYYSSRSKESRREERRTRYSWYRGLRNRPCRYNGRCDGLSLLFYCCVCIVTCTLTIASCSTESTKVTHRAKMYADFCTPVTMFCNQYLFLLDLVPIADCPTSHLLSFSGLNIRLSHTNHLVLNYPFFQCHCHCYLWLRCTIIVSMAQRSRFV